LPVKNKSLKYDKTIIMSGKTFSTLGTITKKETLQSVDFDGCKSLILEISKPFPGYHGHNLPEKNIPESLFLVTKERYTNERIVRAVLAAKKKTNLLFDATPGVLYLQNSLVGVVRFKHLKYKDIPEVAKLLVEEGIGFKKQKLVSPYDSIIHIRKFFEMEQIGEGVYRDLTQENMFYFEVPKKLDWDLFEKMTIELKYNMEDSNFDVALVYVYTVSNILDLVRVFDTDCPVSKLETIKRKYLEKIN
jgi:hypothetical protein